MPLPDNPTGRIVAAPTVETNMRLAGTIVGIVLLLLGGVWSLQGANFLGGSVMSGPSQWLYIGLIMLAAGIAILLWSNFRRGK